MDYHVEIFLTRLWIKVFTITLTLISSDFYFLKLQKTRRFADSPTNFPVQSNKFHPVNVFKIFLWKFNVHFLRHFLAKKNVKFLANWFNWKLNENNNYSFILRMKKFLYFIWHLIKDVFQLCLKKFLIILKTKKNTFK